MRQAATISVPFTQDNVKNCLCPTCPVQQDSQCVKGKMGNLENAKQSGSSLKPSDIPAVYCSSGKATCQDIDTSRSCICPDCAVFSRYDLNNGKPVMYYCRDGKAHA